MLNMTSSSRRKSNTKRRLDRQLYRPREVLKAAETLTDTPQDSFNLLSKGAKKAKDPDNIKSMSCHYIAQSDDLDAFLDESAYPQSMDDGSPPDVDTTSAFEKIGAVSDQQSAADFQSWTKKAQRSTCLPRHLEAPHQSHWRLGQAHFVHLPYRRSADIHRTPTSKAPESKPV